MEKELGIKEEALRRCLKVARYATREQARWNIGAVLAAGRLVQRLAESPNCAGNTA